MLENHIRRMNMFILLTSCSVSSPVAFLFPRTKGVFFVAVENEARALAGKTGAFLLGEATPNGGANFIRQLNFPARLQHGCGGGGGAERSSK